MYGLKPEHRPVRKFNLIAFDTEDNGQGVPDNFICGCVYGDEGSFQFTKRNELRDYILKGRKAPTIVLAHNLAYDLANLDYPEGSVKLIPAKNRVIGAEYGYGGKNKNGRFRKRIRFMDTGNFFVGASLAQLAKGLWYKGKINYDIAKFNGVDPKSISINDMRDILEYCMRDAEICYLLSKKLQDMANSYNVSFDRFTASSLALEIFKRNFLDQEDAVFRSYQFNNDCERLAYYGGRTEVFDYRYYDEVSYEDINSSYPTAMLEKESPKPDNSRRYSAEDWNDIKYAEGISLVRIKVPKMHIPPLPYRSIDGKLLFPYGEWTGAYTHPELRMAERYGVRIIEVFDSILYQRTFTPFKEYIQHFYEKKKESGGITRDFYKLMMNGLSGKFGQKREEVFRNQLRNMDMKEIHDKIVGNMDKFGWVSVIGKRLRDPKHTYPVLIAYITAYGRIKLYEERLIKSGNTIYCDTDSCVSINPPDENIGEELGQWEKEIKKEFVAFAPKYYSFKGTVKLKGVPKKHEVVYVCPRCEKEHKTPVMCCVQLSAVNKMYKYMKPLKLAEAIRRELVPNKWVEIHKLISVEDDKRIKLEDGRSDPIKIIEEYKDYSFESFLDERELGYQKYGDI